MFVVFSATMKSGETPVPEAVRKIYTRFLLFLSRIEQSNLDSIGSE